MPLAKPIIRPRAPVGRLRSLKTPQPGAIQIRRPGQQHQQQQHHQQLKTNNNYNKSPEKPAETCPNPNCPNPRIIQDEDTKVCETCGTVVSEDTLVSEITFGETSAGAAVVQGSFVGADQTHTRTSGPGFHRGGGLESREITMQNGNRYIQQMAIALDIPDSARDAASQIFRLAIGINFIQGRRTKTVAAVCLYIACRRQPGNTVMLIDLSDVLMVNVFVVGRAYKVLLEELRLSGTSFTMSPVDPENLILRFAKQLEFGPKTMQVAKEAVRIVQRMSRDWMTTGRRPAGICGAALILAARMNNFRRTVREVVYVVKVTEVTINQRLNEFSTTDSGGLTVDQFRSVHLENAHDPPSFSQSKTKERKRKAAAETAAEIEGDYADDSLSGRSKGKQRMDADGFAIPDIPIDPALTGGNQSSTTTKKGRKRKTADQQESSTQQPTSLQATNKSRADSVTSSASAEVGIVSSTTATTADNPGQKPSRGRKKQQQQPLPEPTPEELASEEALENEMYQFLAQGSDMVEVAAHVTAVPPKGVKVTAAATEKGKKPVSHNTEIDETEFDSDPEVANCLLSAAEVDLKERIWVHEFRDWLRKQQEKALRRAHQEIEGAENGDARPRKRRRGRLGDVSYLRGEDGESSRASTPAEATRLMLEQRGYSKKINYKMLLDLYGEEGAAEIEKAEAEKKSRSQSVASSQGATSKTLEPNPNYFQEIIKRKATSTEEPNNEENLGGFNEADYDDEDDEAEEDAASEEALDDDRDIENAFAGNYEEDDYYEYD